MRNCKIISTYFGPRRSVLMHKDSESKLDNNISDETGGWVEHTKQFFENYLLPGELEIDSGTDMDTIIVNQNPGDLLYNNQEAIDYLDNLNGINTKNGKIKFSANIVKNGIL